MKASIFNIQKFSIHDGPGIRTVVFFKGCPLSCIWCSNPESQNSCRQLLWDEDKCLHCHTCERICPIGNIRFAGGSPNYTSRLCGSCTLCLDSCPAGALSSSGSLTEISEIMNELMKDEPFYRESGGGITLSGGEVLSQPEAAVALLKSIREKQLHTALETTGCAGEKTFDAVTDCADLLLFDIKHYDRQKHKQYTGVYNDIILKNLARAAAADKKIIIRIPVIPGINDSLRDAEEFCRLLSGFAVTDVDLLPFHQFGQKKYAQLQRSYQMADAKPLHNEDLAEYAEIFRHHSFNVKL